jgi:AbrB family looped-hinge helix DNA binding protein
MQKRAGSARKHARAKAVERAAYSRVSVKSQTVIPREVRERLQIKPGDRLRYRVTENGVLLDKAPAVDAEWLRGLQATFSEWATPEDAAAYDDL